MEKFLNSCIVLFGISGIFGECRCATGLDQKEKFASSKLQMHVRIVEAAVSCKKSKTFIRIV